MQAYHADHNSFPAHAIYKRDAKGQPTQPLLSWRVELLPYLDKEEKELYQKFNRNLPWDHPDNRKLLSPMPNVYRMVDQVAADNTTYYQVFVGKDSPFNGPTPVRVGDVKDGPSNTIGIAEAPRAVEWTKPDDIPFVPTPEGFSPSNIGRIGATEANVVFLDGTVRKLPKLMSAVTLKAMITHNGKEVFQFPD